ncbi:protein phosphatase 2C domain-containing protein [Nocardioides agariphilus]|uniref:Protein phosphatase 2C domain-containing protein n=1 Tax=Nocardioides agariphilus TaxID=433664 RepID=A0A930YP32_9ACTN|nr:protein phosphatase 2C domain-containing protein [Nocardioides agariphilus]MBF4769814.1 protein phosphatase 2C domain-containing protein [Nocardioides agariphilus]
MDAHVSDSATTCPHCGALNEAASKFCESCGKSMTPDAPAATPTLTASEANPLDEVSPISAVTVRPGDRPAVEADRAPCLQCGGVVDDDGYCTQCGTKAPSPRDHFEEQPAPWVAGVCDRGIRHTRNEDAMALAVDGERAVLVVCDGVSNCVDSDVASLAAAKAALDVLRPPLPKGLGVPESVAAAVTKVFTDAAAAGNKAVLETVHDDVPNPPSCTFVAAVLEGTTVHYCGIGDSRVYLLPDAGGGQILTVDDSMAQVLIMGGTPRAEAEASKQAHSITKWLGKDSPDVVPRVGQVEVTGPGWLLACSDGLWNYASEPDALQAQLQAAGSSEPHAIATHLVAFANKSGGQDNITVALARVGQRPVEEVSTSSTSDSSTVGNNAAPDGGESHG